MAICLAGCSGPYRQKPLGPQSAQFRQVQAMLVELRRAGGDKLDETLARQGPNGLDEGRRAALRAVLDELARADSAELKQLDRFGDHVFRAAIALRRDSTDRTLYMLLVERDGQLLWAGPN